MAIKIGYQGMRGSNSEFSANNMATKCGFENVVYVPLITSAGVVDALKNNKIDYGVMATNNIVAGTVIETQNACKNLQYKIIQEDKIPIHHCLFVKDETVLLKDITCVASHIQALSQCKESLNKLLPNAEKKQLEDTAIGAKYLSEGILTNTSAALCRKNAGEDFGLFLLCENIEDFKENYTEFMMINL